MIERDPTQNLIFELKREIKYQVLSEQSVYAGEMRQVAGDDGAGAVGLQEEGQELNVMYLYIYLSC